MWFGLIAAAIAGKYTVWNNPVKNENVNDWRMAKIIWIYYISKLPEFGDTFLMVLKHNYHQVSFLHLYHHSTVFVIWFVVCLVGPCLLYTSDAADEEDSVDLGGRRIIKKKKNTERKVQRRGENDTIDSGEH
eukprot:TRINITY_DN15323_c0_g1_i1.p1 TRINITY_DN15323_c0_g1~~TRINITY_DN15323_c0_g1_i1.p1  ORF type:complete len:132 (-),score=18.40 TRINITY_DN15323_c0_g1_i1:15-410(-)